MQVASLGLLKAIDRFDPRRPTAFSSFAVPTILGELKRHFRDKGWSVRVPRDLQELAVRVERVADELSRELGRAPSPAEIAEQIGTTTEQVLEAREAAGAYRAVSLDRPRDDDEEAAAWPRLVGVEDPGFGLAEDAATVERLMRCSANASARCCACASPRTSRSRRSARASGCRRCTSHA